MTKPSNTHAITRATGVPWDEWVDYLDGLGGRGLGHAEIASRAAERIDTAVGNGGWWAQGVAVAYEQHIGRRAPGQQNDGTYQLAVSRTFGGTMDDAMNAWTELVRGMAAFGGVPADGVPTLTATVKWRYWRVGLADGTRVSMEIHEKTPGKAGMAVNHTRLASPEAAEGWRAVWKALLARIPPPDAART
ncbi:MAG: hypothetical protein ABWX68_14250 [Arthrobacter sp.]|uniref:hypothetical protein n=1 Tax=Arthrobacter sp. TaxID=1667 RepID=UPI003470BE1C